MPKLYEYQGKRLLKSLDIPVPEGDVVTTPAEAKAIARKLGKPVAIKAQVGVTGRFQAGGIKFADNADEAEKTARELLGQEIKGLKVARVLVEEKLTIKDEFYASVVVNDSCQVKRPVLMFSTRVVGGVAPGRGGTEVWGIPVFNTVKEATEKFGPVEASVTFVPGPQVKNAVVEAVEAGIKLVLVPAERVPLHDSLEMIALARQKSARIVGPGSLGLLSAGKAVMGWLGGSEEFAHEIFRPGPVGVMSRSGGQTSTVVWSLRRVGTGITTAIHIGAEPVLGSSFAELLPLFEADGETEVVVLFGEIGTVAEEEAAQVMSEGRFTKPLVTYIAGRTLPSGMRFSHASAIIEGGRGTAESKVKALREAGAYVVERPQEITATIAKILKGGKAR